MATNEKTTYGYIEKATLLDNDLTVSAKLDTGAKSASLYAIHINKLVINGKPYLSFIVPSKEGDILFKCEHIGEVNVKLRPAERGKNITISTSSKRPIVLMNIKIGEKNHKIPVNLANRKRFIYPLLLGRDALIAFDGIVDPNLKFTISTRKMDKK